MTGVGRCVASPPAAPHATLVAGILAAHLCLKERQPMPTDPPVAIRAQPRLIPADIDQVESLRMRCNEHEGLDLKLGVAPIIPGGGQPQVPSQFLAYSGDQLAGYCSLDHGGDIEICGMVHPAQR